MLLSQVSKHIAFLVINGRCQISCDYCYATGIKRNDISLDTVKLVIKFLESLGVNYVVILGGEPTIHSSFLKIIELFTDAKIRIFLNTNSISFSKKAFLEEVLAFDNVIFNLSLKSTTKKGFIESTGANLFSKHMKGIENIIDSRGISIMNTVLSRGLIKEFDEILKEYKRLNFNKAILSFPYPAFLSNSLDTNSILSSSEIINFFTKNSERINSTDIVFDFRTPSPLCLFPQKFFNRFGKNFKIRTICLAKKSRAIAIDAEGYVFPCTTFHWPTIGRIGVDFKTAREFLNHKKKEGTIKIYKRADSLLLEKCNKCNHFMKCKGGCPLLHEYHRDLLV